MEVVIYTGGFTDTARRLCVLTDDPFIYKETFKGKCPPWLDSRHGRSRGVIIKLKVKEL